MMRMPTNLRSNRARYLSGPRAVGQTGSEALLRVERRDRYIARTFHPAAQLIDHRLRSERGDDSAVDWRYGAARSGSHGAAVPLAVQSGACL